MNELLSDTFFVIIQLLDYVNLSYYYTINTKNDKL